jgi:spore germination cell wall hydrolase CwlJ-like protein
MPVRNQCQFSWYCDGLSDTPHDTEAWLEARTIAYDFLEDDIYRGITEGSTHYHASYIEPNWVNDRGMQEIGMIGGHKFYRWNR